MANVSSYRSCFVPGCENTSFSAPDKIFFNVPRGERRMEWCAAAGVQKELSLKSTHSCCADHFKVEEDVENWQQYHYIKKMGMKARLRLKRDVLPHIFPRRNPKKSVNINKMHLNPDVASSSSKETDEVMSRQDFRDHSKKEMQCHSSQDQFLLNSKGGVLKTLLETPSPKHFAHHFGNQKATSETNEATYEEDISNQSEDSEPVSYLATAVLGEQEDSDHNESIVPMSPDRKDYSPGIPGMTAPPVRNDSESFNRVLNVKSLSSSVPEHLVNYVVSLHNELQQKKIECQKNKRKASRLQEEVDVLRSGILNGEDTEPPINEYEIQGTKGKKIRCFGVGLADLNNLHKRRVVSDTNILRTEEEETDENSTIECLENENVSNENSSNSDFGVLQARVLALESECSTLRSANSQLINEKAEVLNEYHKLKAELKRLWKEQWNLQMLNSQLTSDNEKLLESLKATENSPND